MRNQKLINPPLPTTKNASNRQHKKNGSRLISNPIMPSILLFPFSNIPSWPNRIPKIAEPSAIQGRNRKVMFRSQFSYPDQLYQRIANSPTTDNIPKIPKVIESNPNLGNTVLVPEVLSFMFGVDILSLYKVIQMTL